MIISNWLYDNATFLQVVDECHLIHYNINITCAHIDGLIHTEWHVLIRNIGLKIEWRLTDNRTVFWSRLTGFFNNRHTTVTALIWTLEITLCFNIKYNITVHIIFVHKVGIWKLYLKRKIALNKSFVWN